MHNLYNLLSYERCWNFGQHLEIQFWHVNSIGLLLCHLIHSSSACPNFPVISFLDLNGNWILPEYFCIAFPHLKIINEKVKFDFDSYDTLVWKFSITSKLYCKDMYLKLIESNTGLILGEVRHIWTFFILPSYYDYVRGFFVVSCLLMKLYLWWLFSRF